MTTHDPSHFDVETSVIDENARVMLRGELDMATAPVVQETLARLQAEGVRFVTADLSALDFIDSGGLGALVLALKRQREAGGDISLCCVPPGVLKALQIMGIDKIFQITDS